MKDDKEKSPEIEALYKRFEELLMGSSISDEEKRALSEEMLKIIFGGDEEAVQ